MPTRKVFVRNNLPPVPGVGTNSGLHNDPSCTTFNPRQTVVTFPEAGNASTARSFDFARWYGTGIDGITHPFQIQIERWLATYDNDLTATTISRICAGGVVGFLNFCNIVAKSHGQRLGLDDIDRALIEAFLDHLRNSELSKPTQRTKYSQAKSVLVALKNRRLLRNPDLFPRNPTSGAHHHIRGAKALEPQEQKALTAALKTRVMRIYRDDTGPLDATTLAYCLLAVALRTGRNVTPLIEMGEDCLRDHFLPGRRLLVVLKRRSRGEQAVHLRVSEEIELMTGVLPDTVRIIERVRYLTQSLRNDAPPHLRNRLWLYRRRAANQTAPAGSVSALSHTALNSAARALERKLGAVASNGNALRINVSRLRKTFVNRVYDLSGQNPTVSAAAAGHTVQVSDRNYLSAPHNARKNWRFMGELLAQQLLGNKASTSQTPNGHCGDPKNGEFAPKNGSTCISFMNCLRCRAYVVTTDDLHRLFSFYWLIVRERDVLGQKRWKKNYAHLRRIIDHDIADAGIKKRIFTRKAVEEARAHAKANPHPYWASRALLPNPAP